VAALLAIGALMYVAYQGLTGFIRDYTSTSPAPIPQVEMTEDRRKSLDERWAAFRKSLDESKAAEIELDGDELNALVSEDEDLKGKVYLTIKGQDVTAQVSIPLDKLPLPGVRGRYFNGSATLTGSIMDGQLVVFAKQLEVNGKPVPDSFTSQLAGKNLAEEFNKDPKKAEKIRKIESFEVKDGKIRIKSRDVQGQTPGESPAGKEAKDSAPATKETPKAGAGTEGSLEPKVEVKSPGAASDQPAKEAAKAKTEESIEPKEKVEAPAPK
jgi:hypothetical protein